MAGITVRASEERLREMGKRLRGWIREVSDEDGDSTKMECGGLVMFFPTEPGSMTDVSPPTGSGGS